MNFDIIERKRKARNLSISELCKLAEIDRKTYYRLLGDPKNAKFSTASKLVSVLRLNASEKSQIFN